MISDLFSVGNIKLLYKASLFHLIHLILTDRSKLTKCFNLQSNTYNTGYLHLQGIPHSIQWTFSLLSMFGSITSAKKKPIECTEASSIHLNPKMQRRVRLNKYFSEEKLEKKYVISSLIGSFLYKKEDKN